MKNSVCFFFLFSAAFWLSAGVFLFVSRGVFPFEVYQMNAVLMIVNAAITIALLWLLIHHFKRWFFVTLVYVGAMAVLCLLDEVGVIDVVACLFYLVFFGVLLRSRRCVG